MCERDSKTIEERTSRVDTALARQLGDSIALNAKLKAHNTRLKAEVERLNELIDSMATQVK